MDLTKNIVILSGVYADQFDITIKVNDQGVAATDGNTVWIPKPKPEYEAMTWGYCAHEAGHLRDTDIELFTKTKKANPFLGWLLNVVEDTRIERIQLEYFPGVKKHFDVLSEQVLKYNWDENKDKPLAELLIDYVFYYIRGYITNYPIWDENTKSLQETLNARYNLLFMYSFNQLLDKVRELESTQEALELSEEILTYLDDAANEEDDSTEESNDDSSQDEADDNSDQEEDSGDNSQQQSGDDSDDDSNSDGNQSNSGDDSSEDSNDSNDGSDQPTGDSSDEESQQQGGSPSGSEESDEEADNDSSSKGAGDTNSESNSKQQLSDEAKESLKEAIAKTLDELGSGDLGDTLKEILSDSKNQEPLTKEERYALTDVTDKGITITQAQIDTEVQIASQTTSQLRNGLVRLIEDQTRSQRVTGRKGRRLAKGKCHRLIVGDTRIFKRKFTERDEVNCDVAVLSDYSASMDGNMKSVQTATFSLLDCLSRIEGANTCAYGFGGLGIVEIQRPNQRFDQVVKGRIFSLNATGGTPATEAYWASIKALRRMGGSKKVVIMVTDGEPNDTDATFSMVTAMKKQGIKVIALGVGVTSRAHGIFNGIYGTNKWIYVKDFSDLPRELIRVAKEVI